MKKYLLSAFLSFFFFQGFSQLLSWSPDFPTETGGTFVVTMDANYGNKGLLNYTTTDVYVHIGVITNKSSNSGDWKYVKSTWGSTDASFRASSLGNNKWSFTISGGIRSYFGISDPTETILKIAILFRSGDGSKVQRNADGSDMFIPVYTSSLAVRITEPFFQPTYTPVAEPITKSTGDQVVITGKSNANATLTISFNGSVIATASGAQTITASPVITDAGNQQVIITANEGTTSVQDVLNFFANSTVNIASLPAGVRTGINYNGDGTSATLVLYAPGKGRVNVIGEFPGSNWTEQASYQMNKTPDGNYWWLTVSGLTSGQEYGYQYLVDGSLKIADPYAEKILDPANDPFISSATYPALKSYPTGLTTGIVSVLQTGQVPYSWQASFTKPDKKNLVVYELLVRDFVASHNWQTLSDTLPYLKKLGINAIELMPFNEFEGNISWGYNPDFYFAPDKYYGPASTLKHFIDQCHQNGIAVIMDIALNHAFGSSPMVQLYWDAVNNRPATNNPWYNPVAKHAYNVGYDMNHESPATHYFVSRVLEHWTQQYKIDGFRFDLSKGFTQTQTCDNNGGNCNVSAWGAYDQSRVNIWKGYYDTLQLKSSGAYCILEHFADNSEEKVLSDYGMLLWGNGNYNYNQASMGYSTDWNFDYTLAGTRGWTNPYLDGYMESHDEERLMYKNITYGNASGGYNIKDTATALKRQELAGAFFLMLPGPKMIWQFGELGYDYSITSCNPGNTIPQPYPQDNCRTDPKPIRWDYLQQPNRKKLYDVYSALIQLRFHPSFSDQFISNASQQDFSSAFKWLKLEKIVVVGNFDVTTRTGSVLFPSSGTWYDYLNGGTINVGATAYAFTLAPGEYHIYTKTSASLPVTMVSFTGKNEDHKNILSWQVASELNLDHYEIERSADGKDFLPVGNVKAIGSDQYSFTDEDAGAALLYYRIRSVDKDGKFGYSRVISIKTAYAAWQVTVSPNPVQNGTSLYIRSPRQQQASFVITDISGRILYRRNVSVSAGSNQYKIDGMASFSKGIYMVAVICGSEKQTLKLIKSE